MSSSEKFIGIFVHKSHLDSLRTENEQLKKELVSARNLASARGEASGLEFDQIKDLRVQLRETRDELDEVHAKYITLGEQLHEAQKEAADWKGTNAHNIVEMDILLNQTRAELREAQAHILWLLSKVEQIRIYSDNEEVEMVCKDVLSANPTNVLKRWEAMEKCVHALRDYWYRWTFINGPHDYDNGAQAKAALRAVDEAGE